MKPQAWISRTGYLIPNHPLWYGYDPDDWEPLYTPDQVRDCVPARAIPYLRSTASYDEGWDDCRRCALASIANLSEPDECA